MNQAEIEEKEKELRKKYPKSFSHPDARPGEVCLGPTVYELQAGILSSKGLTTVRMVGSDVRQQVQVSVGGGPFQLEEYCCWMLFADLKQFIEFEYGC